MCETGETDQLLQLDGRKKKSCPVIKEMESDSSLNTEMMDETCTA